MTKQRKQQAAVPLHSLGNMQTPARQRSNVFGGGFGTTFTIPKLKQSSCKTAASASAAGCEPASTVTPEGASTDGQCQYPQQQQAAAPASAQVEAEGTAVAPQQRSTEANARANVSAASCKPEVPPSRRMLPPTVRKPAAKAVPAAASAHSRVKVVRQSAQSGFQSATAFKTTALPAQAAVEPQPFADAAAPAQEAPAVEQQSRLEQQQEDAEDVAAGRAVPQSKPEAEATPAAAAASESAGDEAALESQPTAPLRQGRHMQPFRARTLLDAGTMPEAVQQTPAARAHGPGVRVMPRLREALREGTPAQQM